MKKATLKRSVALQRSVHAVGLSPTGGCDLILKQVQRIAERAMAKMDIAEVDPPEVDEEGEML